MKPTETTDRLVENLQRVRTAIARAAHTAGRDASEVRLVAVTKSVDVQTIRALLAADVRDLGENRVQQLLQRVEQLGSADADLSAKTDPPAARPRWHMIGHLQRNKVRRLLEHVRIVHALDSDRLAAEIERQAALLDATVDVLLEVNVSGELAKHGVAPVAAAALAETVGAAPHIRLCGLMTMAPFVEDPELTRPNFAKLRELLEELRRSGTVGGQCRELSMGMSNDYRVAVEEGATIVRVGSALFEGIPRPQTSTAR